MIDLHCHILSGIDDGAADAAEARTLAEDLVADGVETVTATPHLRSDHPAVRVDELAGRCATLASELAAANIPLAVVPAGEVDLLWAVDASPEDLKLASLGQQGKYLLLETPYGPLTSTFEGFVFQHVMLSGLTVLLAHPERSPSFQQDPQRLFDLVRQGVLLQVTAPALLTTKHRSRSRKLAVSLLEQGLVHNLASDSHGGNEERSANLGQAREAAARVDSIYAEWLVTAAPAAILAGERLPPPPRTPREARRRPWRRRTRES